MCSSVQLYWSVSTGRDGSYIATRTVRIVASSTLQLTVRLLLSYKLSYKFLNDHQLLHKILTNITGHTIICSAPNSP